MRRRCLALVAAAAALALPISAHANGDPASDYLLVQNLFLPYNAKVDSAALKRLNSLLRAANKGGFPIRVALIASRLDLGTAFSLYEKPQRYAQFLGYELSFVYRGRLLVVMPSGFGYAVNAKPDPRASRSLKGLSGPGRNITRQVEAATTAVRRLAAAEGRRIVVPQRSESQSRDRLTIAAAATAGLALIAGLVLFRRRHRARSG